MTRPNEELKEVTKLVLYGWGYPALFAQPNGDRFQNRLVTFPSNALPVIAGADQDTLSRVQSKLKIVKSRYRRLLKNQPSTLNPVWVWVDTPKQLSYQETLAYREQFEDWVKETKMNRSWNDRLLNLDLSVDFASLWKFQHWKQNMMAIAVLTAITLVIMCVQ